MGMIFIFSFFRRETCGTIGEKGDFDKDLFRETI